MAYILSLETSSSICSVALLNNELPVASIEFYVDQSHASKLAPIITQVLAMAGIAADALSAVAVSSGPGSYTGLRIGTSTAKGLCFALKIPLIAVGTLDVLIHHAVPFNLINAHLCALIDARRMEVYSKVVHADMTLIQTVQAHEITDGSFAELLASHKVLFFGDGSKKLNDTIKNDNAFFLDNVFPTALTLGKAAYEKFKANQFEDLSQFNPYYLKEFIAKPARSFF